MKNKLIYVIIKLERNNVSIRKTMLSLLKVGSFKIIN